MASWASQPRAAHATSIPVLLGAEKGPAHGCSPRRTLPSAAGTEGGRFPPPHRGRFSERGRGGTLARQGDGDLPAPCPWGLSTAHGANQIVPDNQPRGASAVSGSSGSCAPRTVRSNLVPGIQAGCGANYEFSLIRGPFKRNAIVLAQLLRQQRF